MPFVFAVKFQMWKDAYHKSLVDILFMEFYSFYAVYIYIIIALCKYGPDFIGECIDSDCFSVFKMFSFLN